MQQFYAYAHFKPDFTPFYVGKGTLKRAYEFKASSRNVWHRRIVEKYGRKNIIVEVMPCRSEAEAFLREQLIIKALKAAGVQLCNMTDGGEGPVGVKRSEETRRKLSIANMGKQTTLGQKRSDYSKKKMSDASKKLWSDPEYKNRLIAAHKGKAMPIEQRKKISEKLKGREFSDEHRARLSVMATIRERNKKHG